MVLTVATSSWLVSTARGGSQRRSWATCSSTTPPVTGQPWSSPRYAIGGRPSGSCQVLCRAPSDGLPPLCRNRGFAAFELLVAADDRLLATRQLLDLMGYIGFPLCQARADLPARAQRAARVRGDRRGHRAPTPGTWAPHPGHHPQRREGRHYPPRPAYRQGDRPGRRRTHRRAAVPRGSTTLWPDRSTALGSCPQILLAPRRVTYEVPIGARAENRWIWHGLQRGRSQDTSCAKSAGSTSPLKRGVRVRYRS
jgi:hypothetical protein